MVVGGLSVGEVSSRNRISESLVVVVATRNHGECIFRVGLQHFLEDANGRREVSRGFVARILGDGGNGWDLRKPGTPPPGDSNEGRDGVSSVAQQDRAQGWSPDRFATSKPQVLTWVDPDNHPGLASDGNFHLIGPHGDVGAEWGNNDWVMGPDDAPPDSQTQNHDPNGSP